MYELPTFIKQQEYFKLLLKITLNEYKVCEVTMQNERMLKAMEMDSRRRSSEVTKTKVLENEFYCEILRIMINVIGAIEGTELPSI